MRFLEKILGKKAEVTIDSEIEKIEKKIAEKELELEHRNRSILANRSQYLQAELQGLRDKLTLLKEKRRREGEKVGKFTQ